MTGSEIVGVAVVAAIAGGVLGFYAPRVSRSNPPADATATPDSPPLERDARFAELLQAITVGIIALDARGYVTSLNAAAGAIFGIGGRPVLGRALIELVPSFELDRRVGEALAGHPSRGTILLTRVNEERTLTVTTVPIDGDGGVIVIASDETRMQELEQTRREFVSSVSHELRTPLSSIKLMVETLLDRQDDAEARALFLPRIRLEVDRMVQLVADLLELARAEAGFLRLRRGYVDLHAVAAAALRTFEQRAAQAKVLLTLAGEPTGVDGDEQRLSQVLVNLVDNALRHTPPGGTVSIVVTPRGNDAVLQVRDTGAGIPYRDLPHIFERFYVVDRSRAREPGGTGLGLSIVKHIVEAHGGEVVAESEFGIGSVFTCVLPLFRTTAVHATR